MNWKIPIGLSMFGLIMGLLTVYLIPSNLEIVFWIPIFVLSAYIVARRAPGKYFLHGFFVGIFNCVWITAAHVLLFSQYAAHHAAEMESYAKLNMGMSIRKGMLLMGPFIGVVSGIVIGLLSLLAAKIVKKQ